MKRYTIIIYTRGIYELPRELPNAKRLTKLGNMRKVSIPHRMNDSPAPSPPAKMKALPILAENPWKTKIKPLPLCAIPHEDQASPKYPVSHRRQHHVTHQAAQKTNKYIRRIQIIFKSFKHLIVKLKNCGQLKGHPEDKIAWGQYFCSLKSICESDYT